MNNRKRRFFLVAGIAGAGGIAAPDVALFFDAGDGRYHVFTDNLLPPDAFFQKIGDEVHIIAGAVSGLNATWDGQRVQLSS